MRFSLIIAALATLLPASARAQQSLMSRAFDKEGKQRIEVESVFDGTLTQGFMPVRVTLRNGQARARDWTLNFDLGGGWNNCRYESAFALPAAPGGESIHDILAPVPLSSGRGSGYRQLALSVSSPGLGNERSSDGQNFSVDWPGIGLSAAIANRNANSLNSEVNPSGGPTGGGVRTADRFGYQFDPRMLPEDWRGYTGLDVLMISDSEWASLAAGARRAIFEWVRLGGRLDFYTTADPAAFLKSVSIAGMNSGGNTGRLDYSLGEIAAFQWDGKILDSAEAKKRYEPVKNRSAEFSNGFMSWGLQADFGKKSFNPSLVILLLIAFGIVVGPVNLFILAKPGQRHRLFITTPIIALVASGLIITLILFSDGIGGSGRRIVIANLHGGLEEKRLYVTQEQISRAGVLLGSAFEVAEPIFLSPVMLRPSEWNRLQASGRTVAQYSLSGVVYRGDWFQSRSEQGHFLQSVQPTRSRIELRKPSPDGKAPPRLFSSLDFTVEKLFYRDDEGRCWEAGNENIAGGDEIVLKSVTPKELTDWWKNETRPFHDSLAKQVEPLSRGNGQFFAVSGDRKAGFVETLDAIRWQQDRALVFGPVVEAEKFSTREEKADQ